MCLHGEDIGAVEAVFVGFGVVGLDPFDQLVLPNQLLPSGWLCLTALWLVTGRWRSALFLRGVVGATFVGRHGFSDRGRNRVVVGRRLGNAGVGRVDARIRFVAFNGNA